MGKRISRSEPQHSHWYEDLPERDAPMDRAPEMVHGDINAIDRNYLEVSRASTLMRGPGLLFGTIGAIIFFIMFGFLFHLLFPIDRDLRFLIAMLPATIVMAVWLTYLLFKIDLMVPRDRPIRLNRISRKVYVYEYAFSNNPFKKWALTIKEFDWNTLRAEIHRYAGFNGKVYVQRFGVWLVSCKPGTHEVVDRFELKGNIPTTEELYNIWAYCRHYMELGPDGLPLYPPRRQEITFRRSLFEYMRFLDPTEEGREVRQRMTWGAWAFNVPFIGLLFWIFLPLGAAHYVAMRFAPEAQWPADVDEESRGVLKD